MKRLLSILGILLILLLAVYTSVEAHAELTRSEPAANTVLSSPPTSIKMWFTEPLDTTLSSARLYNSNGAPIEGTSITTDPADARIMTMSVPALGNEVYTVRWTTFSIIDGHVLKGSFLFSVGVPLSQSAQESEGNSLGSRGGLPFILVKWSVLLSALLWAGSVAFQALALPRVETSTSTAAKRRAYPLLMLVILAAVIASINELIVQAFTLADGDMSRALSWPTIQGVVTNRYGLLTVARIGLLLSSLLNLKYTLDEAKGQRWTIIQLATAGLALLTMALSGHAAAVSRPLYSALVMDWLHLAGTAIWVGGISYIAVVLIPAARSRRTRSDRGPVAIAISAFSPLALSSVAVLTVTGLLNAELHLDSLQQMVTTTYGRALTIKLLLVAAMISISYMHAFVIRPKVGAATARKALDRATASRDVWIARLIRLQVPLGGLVLLAVAVMTAFPTSTGISNQAANEAVDRKKPLVLASNAGDTLVTLGIAPNDLGLNTLTVSLKDLNALPVDRALVRLRTRYLDQDAGSNFLVTEADGPGQFKAAGSFSQKGRWQVDVNLRFPDNTESSTSFALTIPTSGAEILLTQVQDKVNSLTSLKEKNILTGGSGGISITTEYQYQGPDKLRTVDDKGRESIIIGDERYDKAGEIWTKASFPGYTFPPLALFTNPTEVTLLDTEEMDGKKVFVLAYEDPSLAAHFRWWIGADDFMPRKQLMIAPGHYMTSAYSDFNMPNNITPPANAVVSAGPAPAPSETLPAPVSTPAPITPTTPERASRETPLGPVRLVSGIIVGVLGTAIVYAANRIGRRGKAAGFVHIFGFMIIGVGIYLLASLAIQTIRAGQSGSAVNNGQAAPVNPVPATAESIKQGETIYLGNCAPCHGELGRGDGPASRGMSPRPADLTIHVPLHPDSELRRFITDGIPGTPMPRFSNSLSEEETWHLVNYLRQRFPGS